MLSNKYRSVDRSAQRPQLNDSNFFIGHQAQLEIMIAVLFSADLPGITF
jgi:hypothetical protein